MHPAIVNFAFGDGSVRALRKTNTLPTSGADIVNRTDVPWDALQRYTGIADSDVIVEGVLSN